MNGLILGKFMPPHQGHLALWRFALQQCDTLTILVESRPDEPISAEQRKKWIEEEMSYHWANKSALKIEVLYGNHPQSPEEHPEFWNYWKEILGPYADKATHLFASDDYGKPLSAHLNLEWVPFQRHTIPTSATQLRQNPWQAWPYWLDSVKKDCAKRIVLIGPESTGKSTAGLKLSQHYETPLIPEYAEYWIKRKGISTQNLQYSDYDQFLKGQKASRLSMATRANRLYFEDSNALTTALYEEITFGQIRNQTLHLAKQDAPDALLVFSPQNAPWRVDIHRLSEEPNRKEFFEKVLNFSKQNWPKTKIEIVDSPTWEQREQQAIDHVDTWSKEWSQAPFLEWAHSLKHQSSTTNPLETPKAPTKPR